MGPVEKAVVSTSIGSEELHAVHEENILIADTASRCAEVVRRVLEDPTLRNRLESNARLTAEREYSWEVIGKEMREQYMRMV